MQRKTDFVEGEYYHIYNRGVDKRIIFSSRANYERFMLLLHLANSAEDVRLDNLLKYSTPNELLSRERQAPLVSVGAFCLMPNHFHILATPLTERGLTRFMLKLQTGYSMYFNHLNERSGSLFQGPFKSEHADDDRYLKYLFSYIHMNPVKLVRQENNASNQRTWNEREWRFLINYPYSSLAEYVSATPLITDPSRFPAYFSTTAELKSHITDWLIKDREISRK